MAQKHYTLRYFRSVAIFLTVGIAFQCTCSQVIVQENIGVESILLNRTVKVNLILPVGYGSSEKTYPTVFLLHGIGGDHTSWLNRCHVDRMIDSLHAATNMGDYIYVLPDAGNSYYINNYDSTNMYADFFIHELVPYIDNHYRTQADRSHRALLGLSMGGYGSVMLALHAPELFGIVVALSAAVRNEPMVQALPQDRYNWLYGPVFGTDLQGDERITEHWKQNTPYYLIDSTNSANYTDISWYIDCGLDDFLLPASEAFHKLLQQYGIPHEYHIRPGKHNWAYWYLSTVDGLIFIDEIIKQTE